MLRKVHIKQPVEVQVRESLLLARRSSTSAKQIHDKEGPLFFFSCEGLCELGQFTSFLEWLRALHVKTNKQTKTIK